MLAWTKNVQSATQGSSASGLLTLNKENIKLAHACVDLVNPEEPTVVLSDKPLPPDNFSISMLSDSYIRQKKVHAILFSLSPKEKKLSGSLNFFYFPGKKTHFVALGNDAALSITRFDSTAIVGKYKTPKPVVDDFNEVTFSFDASFQVNLGKSKAGPAPSKKVTIKGDGSPPAKAYGEYYRACLAGEIDKIREFIAEKERNDFDLNMKESREVVMYVLTERPSSVEIGTPAIAGDSASFTVHGSMRPGEKATGSVKMVLEKGKWKVREDKWTITPK
jgi:hypothetical protein